MMDREEARKKREAKCRYFNGILNVICIAGAKYPDVNQLPCYGEHKCARYSPLTAEELAAKEAEQQQHMDLMRRGLSTCCEAPLDTSCVITSGRNKGHGPRFCSK